MANKLYKPLLIDSVLATADLPKQRFISFSGAIVMLKPNQVNMHQ